MIDASTVYSTAVYYFEISQAHLQYKAEARKTFMYGHHSVPKLTITDYVHVQLRVVTTEPVSYTHLDVYKRQKL